MFESKEEHHCRTQDMSPGGVRFFCGRSPEVGEKVVVYIDELGRFSGTAVRRSDDGFCMTLDASKKKREALADKLTWFANRDPLHLPDQRRHERVEPFQKFALLRSQQGDEHVVKLRDLSASGVCVETIYRSQVGESVSVGRSQARVVRIFAGGFAAEFERPFAPGSIDEMTRL